MHVVICNITLHRWLDLVPYYPVSSPKHPHHFLDLALSNFSTTLPNYLNLPTISNFWYPTKNFLLYPTYTIYLYPVSTPILTPTDFFSACGLYSSMIAVLLYHINFTLGVGGLSLLQDHKLLMRV